MTYNLTNDNNQNYFCFQILISLDAIGHQKTHGHAVPAQTHVDSLRVTVIQMKNVLEISNAELIIVLISSLLLLIAVLQLSEYLFTFCLASCFLESILLS